MKRQGILLAISVMLVMVACNQSTKNGAGSSSGSYHISGNISGVDTGWVFLMHTDTSGNRITDSTPISRGAFSFSGVVREPRLYYLSVKGSQHPGLTFFLENADITLQAKKDSLGLAEVTGSAAESAYQAYLDQVNPIRMQMNALLHKYQTVDKSKDQTLIRQLDNTYDALDSTKKVAIERYVSSHPASIISAWAIARNFLYNPDVTQLTGLYSSLDSTVKQSSYGRLIKKSLDIAGRLAVGKQAPDFTEDDVHGKPLSLSSLKGKYVLVDFWASWCEPCRAENPNVVKAYHKYEHKDFTVLGVSLDTDSSAWMKAIHKDHLDWNQVSDLKGWRNAVAEQYGIRAIPSNFLLDKNGVIMAHDLRGDKLEKELASVLK